MTETLESSVVEGIPSTAEFPDLRAAEIPANVTLETRLPGGSVQTENVQAVRAWQVLIQPFATDADAALVLRALSVDRDVAVQGGSVTALPSAHGLPPHPLEAKMTQTGVAFDILVLEFDPPNHPWVFSLSPPITKGIFPCYPHLRTDRVLRLPSVTVHGLCVYSASEFSFDSNSPILPQLLRQTAIYLAKQVIWVRTLQLYGAKGLIGEASEPSLLFKNFNPNIIWQQRPTERTMFLGHWAGTSALSGMNHFLLNPEGECWCGKGRKYKDCCRPREFPGF